MSGNAGGHGILAEDDSSVDVRHSTIVGNARGGIAFNNGGTVGPAKLRNTIVAGNGSLDLSGDDTFLIDYSLIQSPGTAVFSGTVPGSNLIGQTPKLAPLADNGGQTKTHALLNGSPAVNAGDPAFTPPPKFDQRGANYARVSGGRVDLGAFEVQTTSPPPIGQVEVDHRWSKLCPAGLSSNALVFLGVPTYNDSNPGVLRMRPRSDATCPYQVRFQEWDYRARVFDDREHGKEQAAFLGLAPGRYRMADGAIWEVGRATVQGTANWTRVAFSARLPGKPSLFLTPQTANADSAVVLRARQVDARGFEAALDEEEFLMNGHAKESFGYLAIYHPRAVDGTLAGGQATLNGRKLGYTLARKTINRVVPAVKALIFKRP